MEAEEAFGRILENDETIVEAFKPNKTRSITLGIIRDIVVSLFVVAIGVIFLIAALSGTKDSSGNSMSPVIGIVIIAIAVLCDLCSIVSRTVRYSKLWYCYTNKRIIIRSGFIGVDYKSLEFKSILAIDVRVDFWDKFIKPNPGSVIFGSAAAPMMMYNNNNRRDNSGNGSYAFLAINDPYDAYKRIKEYIDNNKEPQSK